MPNSLGMILLASAAALGGWLLLCWGAVLAYEWAYSLYGDFVARFRKERPEKPNIHA